MLICQQLLALSAEWIQHLNVLNRKHMLNFSAVYCHWAVEISGTIELRILVWLFLYIHILCIQAARGLANLCLYADSTSSNSTQLQLLHVLNTEKKKTTFFSFQTFKRWIYHAKMSTIVVGIITFMTMINFILSCVEHGQRFVTKGPSLVIISLFG